MKPLPQALDGLFAAAGAAAWGAVDYTALAPVMSPIAREKAAVLCPHPRTVLIAAFPYFAADAPGNLSLYARGEDYHLVLRQKLTPICDFLSEEYPEYLFLPGADSSPLPEREAAWRAGMGLRGKNGLLILPPYGSYVFLGTVLTDCPFDVPETEEAPGCCGCGRCLAVCPTAALGEGGVEERRCLSDLTQRKGEVTAEEASALRAHSLIWGCDLCQRCCPYNAHPALTPLTEFREDLVTSLKWEDLEGLTNRTFQERYAGRAFTWRGPGPLRRNLELKEE